MSPSYTNFTNGTFKATDFQFSFSKGYFTEFHSSNITELWEKSNFKLENVLTAIEGKRVYLIFIPNYQT